MRVLHRRLLIVSAVVLALVPVAFGIRLLDRMALAYTTGLRRSADSPGFGGVMPPADGPPPGVAFIGFSQPAEGRQGFVMRRVTAQGRDAGLRNGDLVTAVDGVTYRDARAAMGGLISTRTAGETVDLAIERGGESLTLPLRLSRYVRHPGDLGLPYEEVSLASGSGYTLRGWWIPPPEDSDGRAVVWVHGAHSSRYQALDHGAEFLHARGYGILTMDLSGRGSSDGEYITYTWNERHDVRSAVGYLRQRQDADESRVVVFGTSNGAASAIYAAAELGDLPALALDAPYADLWRAAGSMLEMRGGIPALRGPLALFVRLRTGLRIREVPARRGDRGHSGTGAFPARRSGPPGASRTQPRTPRGAAGGGSPLQALAAPRRRARVRRLPAGRHPLEPDRGLLRRRARRPSSGEGTRRTGSRYPRRSGVDGERRRQGGRRRRGHPVRDRPRTCRPAGFAFALLAGCGAPDVPEPAVVGPAPDYAELASRLSGFVTAEMEHKGIPALALALTDGDRIVWARGFGEARPGGSGRRGHALPGRVGLEALHRHRGGGAARSR